jgi:peptidoglycan/xylan/chitin deacetylase (PgdA/CDA1 family)
MLQTAAKIAVSLNIDDLANTVVERFFRRFQVLTYHKVSPDTHPFFEPTHPVVFEQQMQFLKECYQVFPLTELVECSQRGDVPDRAVAITFDDGYSDNYEFAFPILKKYQLPATVFVATGVIETGERLWHDRIFDAFRFATAQRARQESAEDRYRELQSALARARHLYGENQREWVHDVEDRLEPRFPSGYTHQMLSWEQIREMNSAGIEFGSHTVNHPILSRLPHHELMKELQESKEQLEGYLDTPVVSFAYPNGKPLDYNDGVKAALKECGYSYAVTTSRGFNRPYEDPFELKRGQPWHKDIELFRMRFFLQRHGLAS